MSPTQREIFYVMVVVTLKNKSQMNCIHKSSKLEKKTLEKESYRKTDRLNYFPNKDQCLGISYKLLPKLSGDSVDAVFSSY